LGVILICTVKSDDDCPLTPSCPLGQLSSQYFVPCFGTGCALSSYGLYLPHTKQLSRTGNFFQSPKLNQTVSLILRNFSNMFVAELWCKIVLTYIVVTIWKVCFALLLLRRRILLEWL